MVGGWALFKGFTWFVIWFRQIEIVNHVMFVKVDADIYLLHV